MLSSFAWRDKIESSHGLPKIDLLMKRRSDFHADARQLNYVQRKHTTTDRPCLTAVGIGTLETCRLLRKCPLIRVHRMCAVDSQNGAFALSGSGREAEPPDRKSRFKATKASPPRPRQRFLRAHLNVALFSLAKITGIG